jgi:hypothetical protein
MRCSIGSIGTCARSTPSRSASARAAAVAGADRPAPVANAAGLTGDGVAGAGVVGVAAGRSSRSAATMRPPGPVPRTVRRSMLRSAASRLVSGDATTRPVWTTAVGAAADGVAAGGAAAEVGAAAVAVGAADVGASSPASRNQPMRSPQAKVSPTWPTRCRRPVAAASTSVSVLSVSIRRSGAPAATSSPSAANHSVIVPSSIVKPSFGIRNSVAMGILSSGGHVEQL